MVEGNGIEYPRKPGSDVLVDEAQYVVDNPIGHCPACGSIGIEEIAHPGDLDMMFWCSDPTCKDMRGHRTTWGSPKPDEYRKKELTQAWSWNAEHFPDQQFPRFCPD